MMNASLLSVLFLSFSGITVGVQSNEKGNQPLRCYKCSGTPHHDQCFHQTEICSSNSICIFAKEGPRMSKPLYVAGCSPRHEGCQNICGQALSSGRLVDCSIRCCFGDLCNGGLTTTARPFTTTPFHKSSTYATPTRYTTKKPTTLRPTQWDERPSWYLGDRYKRCYTCIIASSKKQCLSRTSFCSGRECFSGMATLKKSNRTYYFAGCLDRFSPPGHHYCNWMCDRAVDRGLVLRSQCSTTCCRGDLCNRKGLSTPIPFTTRQPKRKNKIILRVLCNLQNSLKNFIQALKILLRSHINHDRVRGYKREGTSMINHMRFHVQRLGDSRDPEVVRVKQDIIATRLRAQSIIKKLDEFLEGKDSYDDNNNK